jgi:hypothetical protein
MLVWFRWHYDKRLLKNIDDDEFMEFSAKCPERQAVMVSAQTVIGCSRRVGLFLPIQQYLSACSPARLHDQCACL